MVSSSRNSTLAMDAQLIPSSSSTSALARRASRCAAEPSRASSIRSRRDSLSRKRGGIMGTVESSLDRLARGFSGFPQSRGISADEAVIFADAAHPTHAVRPVGCWAPKETPVAVEQSSERDRLNIHRAIDLATGQSIMKDVLTVDALSTIMLLM